MNYIKKFREGDLLEFYNECMGIRYDNEYNILQIANDILVHTFEDDFSRHKTKENIKPYLNFRIYEMGEYYDKDEDIDDFIRKVLSYYYLYNKSIIDDKVYNMFKDGLGLLTTVKYHKSSTGYGLKESKEICDNIKLRYIRDKKLNTILKSEELYKDLTETIRKKEK